MKEKHLIGEWFTISADDITQALEKSSMFRHLSFTDEGENQPALYVDKRAKRSVTLRRRGSGKTEMLKWLIQKQKGAFKEVFIVSPSSFGGQWKGVIPDSNVTTDYREEWVESLIKKMTEANKGKTKASKDFKRVLLILDDVVSSEIKSHHSKTLKTLAARGRHCGIACGLTAQWCTSISPLQRLNSDMLIVGLTNAASIDILFKEFNLGNMNEKEFK
eukprot:50215-Eustigmatos_ZCMA.PRE.1